MKKKQTQKAKRSTRPAKPKRRQDPTPTLTLSAEEFESRREELRGRSVNVAFTGACVVHSTAPAAAATSIPPEDFEKLRTAVKNGVRNKVDPVKVNKIHQLKNAGIVVTEIAKEVHLSVRQVYRHLGKPQV